MKIKLKVTITEDPICDDCEYLKTESIPTDRGDLKETKCSCDDLVNVCPHLEFVLDTLDPTYDIDIDHIEVDY